MIRAFSCLIVVLLIAAVGGAAAAQPAAVGAGTNLALAAEASTSYVSPHETIKALNDGYDPRHSDDKSKGAYGNWPRKDTQWVQYEWSQPISTRRIDVYWFNDNRGVRLPKECRLSYWNGSAFVAVANAQGLGLAGNKYNSTTFDEVRTTRLRLEFDSSGESTGLLEWKVYDSGNSPNFKPVAEAGVDRVVVRPGKTYLNGLAKDDGKPGQGLSVAWSKSSGPGQVTFADPAAGTTTATFSAAGEYVLKLTASDGQLEASDTLRVLVEPAPLASALRPIPTTRWKVDSPLWNDRVKKLIINWIPHCYNRISDPNLKEGGIENFTQAGLKLAGKPHGRHQGAVFANGWVYNTLEAMCVAMMVDPQGDAEIIRAQEAIRQKLEDWIPKILSAQEADGYLQTFYTLNNTPRWRNRHDHEGYLAGYFMEAAIAHYQMTGGQDRRMYEAAKKLADCWCNNVGPAPKRTWYDGHQALEMALVRLGRCVDEVEGAGQGKKYVELAKFLLDCRRNGEEYDQSHLPVVQQYEAVGHAVRAVYSYAAMADIARETGDVDYHSATRSLWDNIVNRKYYLTGGVGSGETSEGFGKDYSLPNHSYCESCAGCGELFFQHRMHLIHHEAKYADLYEETIYNAILGAIDLEGKNFTYTNGLDAGGARYAWHVCPCCVGNIPRTLLLMPTWMYTKDERGLNVNLFVGSSVNVGPIAGTAVEIVQATDYPWSGNVSITVNPAQERPFSVRLRVPRRNVSALYASEPPAGGIASLSVNGQPIAPTMENGYAVLTRSWKAGDRIELVLPMPVQRVKCDEKVQANLGRVALRRGPLIYNLESVDQDINQVLGTGSSLSAQWKPELLGGAMVINGTFANGTAFMAIPNYARQNRGGRSIVWMRDR